MPRMRAPYTGVVFDVAPENVERRLARGFALLEPWEPPAAEVDEVEPEHEAEPEPEQTAEPETPAPTADSTIAEIRAWAEAHGVELPAKGNKAELLEAVGKARA